MSRYTPILTELGSQLILDSLANGTNITLKYFAWGDSNGFQTPPNPIQTALNHEVYRKEIDYVFLDPNMINWLDVLTIIPSDVGGFTVREVGIFTQDGSLFAVAEHPEFYKSIPIDGTTIEFKEKFIIKIGNLTEVNITLNPMSTLDATSIGNGSVSNEEFQCLDGVTSPIQPQLDGKVNRVGDTMTGNLTIPEGTLSGHAVNKGQLDAKVDRAGDTMTGNLTIPDGTLSGHAVNLGQLGSILEAKLPPTFLSGLTLSNSNSSGATEIIAVGTTSNTAYRSLDNGATWDLGVPIPTEISNSAVDSITQLMNGDLLATGNVTQLIYRSTDRGYTWTSGTKVDPSVVISLRGITQLTNGDVLATGFTSNKVYRSIDNGVTWDPGVLVRTGAGLQNITQLANGYILATGDTTKKVYTSKDNGVTWGDGVLVPSATSLSNIVQSKDGPILVLARNDRKIYKSTDVGNLGTTWDPGTSIPVPVGTSLHGLCKTITGDILVSGNGNKIFRSLYPSNGADWDAGTFIATGASVTGLVQVRTSGDILATGYQSDSIHRSSDQGLNWDSGSLVEYGSGLDSMVQLASSELLVTGNTSNKVYKSIDKGDTWDSGVLITDASSIGDITQLVNGSILVTDRVTDKVYKSIDKGDTWDSGVLIENLIAVTPNTQVSGSNSYNFSINGDVTSQIPDHSTVKMQGGSGIEYVVSATYDGINDITNIFRDDSLEIDPIDRALYAGGTLLKKSTSNSIRGILQTSNGSILVTGEDSGKVYKSFDNGATWDIGTLIDSGAGICDIIQTANGSIRVLGYTSNKVYTSTDNGNTWDSGVLVASGAGLIGIIQTDYGDLVVTGALSKKVYRSRNNGLNWSSGVSSYVNPRPISVNVLTNGDVAVCGYSSDRIYLSEDNGSTWDSGSLVSNGTGLMSVIQLANGDLLATNEMSNRVFKSTDYGVTWDTGIVVASGFFLDGIIQLSNGSILAVAHNNDKVYKSIDNGATWNTGTVISTGAGIRNLVQSTIGISSGRIFATGEHTNKVYMSTDNGVTWNGGGGSGNPWLTGILVSAGAGIFGITEDTNGNLLVTGSTSHKVYKSTDDGLTWNGGNVSPWQTGILIGDSATGITQITNGDILVAGNSSNRIYRSTNGGESWDAGSFSYENFSLGDVMQLSVDSGVGIDISAGKARSDDDTANIEFTSLSSSFKTLDSLFIEGTGNGGLDEGVKTINTWYHVYVISKLDGTSDILFSQNAVSPIMPTDFVYQRRVGSILTDLYGGIVKFQQRGDKFYYLNPRTDYYSGTPGTPSGSWTLLPLGTPYGVRCEALMNISIVGGAPGNGLEALIYVKPTFMNTPQHFVGIYPRADGGGDYVGSRDSSGISIFTDTASRIHRKETTAGQTWATFEYDTYGWIDTRGKN